MQVGVSNLQRTELFKYGMKSVKLVGNKKNTVTKIFFSIIFNYFYRLKKIKRGLGEN